MAHDQTHGHEHPHPRQERRLARAARRLRRLLRERGMRGAMSAVIGYVRWRVRTFRSHRSPLRGEVGQRVESAQRTVASHDPHPHYLAEYRDSERRYWEHIPGWIVEDFGDGASACLDVGCAYGTLMVYCKQVTGAQPYGVDFVPYYMSESLVTAERLEYAVANVELDPIPWDRPFDIVVMTEVLEHLNFQARPTLEKLAASMAPGGRFYLSCPDAADWGSNHRYYQRYGDLPMPSEHHRGAIIDDHVWHFSEDELRSVVESAGFQIVRFAHARGDGSRHFNLTMVLQSG